MTEEIWDQHMDVNLNTVYLDVAHAALSLAIEEARYTSGERIIADCGIIDSTGRV